MTEMMCCPLSGNDGPSPSFYERRLVVARKAHGCSECGEAIPKGARHEVVVGKWDSLVSTYRTCPSCVEIRDHFACGNGWLYGELWSDLEQNFFPDMKAGGPCLDGLSPEAKARLFERRTAWLFDSDFERDGAPPPTGAPT